MLYTPSRVLTCGALLVFETESDIERYRPFARVTAANVDVERKSVSNDCRILLNFFKRSFVAAHLSHTNGGTKRVLKCPVFRDHERKRELPPSACCIFFFSCLTTTNTQGGCVRPNRVLWRHHVGGCPYHKYSLLTKIRLFGTGSYLTLTRAGQIISTCSGVPRNALSRGVVRGKENRDLIDARRATDHKNNVYWNVVAKMQCQWKTACHENDRETERTFTLPRNFGTFYLKNKKKSMLFDLMWSVPMWTACT